MLARLGDVLYWLGCIIAAVVTATGGFIWFVEGRNRADGLIMFSFFIICAIAVWLIGRACRYVFAAR